MDKAKFTLKKHTAIVVSGMVWGLIGVALVASVVTVACLLISALGAASPSPGADDWDTLSVAAGWIFCAAFGMFFGVVGRYQYESDLRLHLPNRLPQSAGGDALEEQIAEAGKLCKVEVQR